MKKVEIIQHNGEKRMIGQIKDRVYMKEVWESKHLYRKLDAWGIDSEVFNGMLNQETDMLVVFDKQNSLFYEVSTKDFKAKGTYLHFKPHRAQIFLPRSQWRKHK